ncbi:MAG: hypothetical protein A3J37_04000 [Alphaproteobacteria bacterium RIFCSPHIGHO2_12_FULL_45_9]|nr:MAG: hypothetical protein A3B66_10160 [Alphaproteobacteria bacterium RIFCSPHIGHO2_02_FULL_46_13]OFW95069.1 MAG: hypothetical protein A3J37_04000 [Alphaproteobacteria bacterium RIFCSPHIGHO2_12_FULL_45_9]
MESSDALPDKAHVLNEKHAKPPITKVSYHGKAGQIFRLHLLNLLMNMVTLGIYSFWGKTRIRRYMTSHIAIQDDRFEYTGTGKELFLGWLKAMLIFLPLFVCLAIPVVNIPAIIVFMGILSVALYLALRYRLSRTKWRGIRFSLAGSLKEYFVLCLKRTFFNIFTLGYAIPKSDIAIWSYIANHMSYGDLKFSYKGDHTKLKKIHLITMSIFYLSICSAVLPIVFGASQNMVGSSELEVTGTDLSPSADAPIAVDQVSPQAGYDETEDYTTSTEVSPKREFDSSMVSGILFMYVGLGIALFARLWYHAALWQEKFRGLYLGNLRFKADVTGGGLAKLYIINMLIIIATLGLGKPIAANRTLRYYATNMRIAGELKDLVSQQQALQQKSGMGDALAADVGFDMGL